MDDGALLGVLRDAADAVAAALAQFQDWRGETGRDGQYELDVAADAAAVAVLSAAGLPVLSEESGTTGPDAELVVVLDPVDGSTNASRGIPWYNTSLCAVDRAGPRAAVVADLVHGHRFEAARGAGASCNGAPLRPTACRHVADAIVGLNGYPLHHLGWKQYRALGSAALDLCAVAAGILDGFVDCSGDGLAPWDFLGGVLVCREAGAAVAALDGGELGLERRVVVAAGNDALLAELLAARARFAA
jgi:fructose-1,6-bisphosphatase/inositol monophosphatase family enzyme